MNDNMQYDVFVSYSSRDAKITRKVVDFLEKNGVTCWIDKNNIIGSENYGEIIPAAIENSRIFLLILSDNAQKAIYVPKELVQAINKKKHVIPFHIDNSPLNNEFDLHLCNIQRIEASGRMDKALDELLALIRKKLAPKEQPPVDVHRNTSADGGARVVKRTKSEKEPGLAKGLFIGGGIASAVIIALVVLMIVIIVSCSKNDDGGEKSGFTPPPQTTTDAAETPTGAPVINDPDVDWFPSAFRLDEFDLITPVRDHSSKNTDLSDAWAALAENRLLAQGKSCDLSEWAIESADAFKGTLYTYNDAAAFSNDLVPLIDESKAPYPAGNSANKAPDSVLKEREHCVTDIYFLSNNPQYDGKREETLKSMLMNGYAVIGNVLMDTASLNTSNGAIYCDEQLASIPQDKAANVQRMVFVGWDDNYSRDNFKAKPSRDGAWLLKGSRGTKVGDNGFYWISYEDGFLPHSGLLTA